MPRKPKQPRAIATTQAIIQAGFLCVADKGQAKTTTREIAERAGVGVGSLYEYFSDKDMIFEEMNRRFVDEVAAMVKEMTPTLLPLSINGVIKQLLGACEKFLNKNDALYLNFIRNSAHIEIKQYTTPLNQALMELAIQYVMRHPEYIRIGNMTASNYVFIHGGIFSVVSHLLDPNPPCSFDELSDSLATIISHYSERELELLNDRQSSDTCE